jgi:hypothetical protein
MGAAETLADPIAAGSWNGSGLVLSILRFSFGMDLGSFETRQMGDSRLLPTWSDYISIDRPLQRRW